MARVPLPLGKRVTVVPEEESEVTKGGIVLPGSQEQLTRGEIIRIGDGVDQVGIERGIRVQFMKWGGVEVEVDEQKYMILEQDEIICVLPEDG